jgi:glycosyltransferase involved in cell wall biosynthesis
MNPNPKPLRILQVTSSVEGGGGEQISVRLHRAFRALGHRSMLFAGRGELNGGEGLYVIPNRWEETPRAKKIQELYRKILSLTGGRGQTRLFPFFEALAFPRVAWDLWRGHEDYTQPGSRRLLALVPEQPDVVLLHNLHARWDRREGFFDLGFLPELSRSVPVILFPQDPWLLTGHCGHPINCPRWRTGCGKCPDLAIYPSIRRDATAWNFSRKRAIYARSRLHLAAPSRWLMEMFTEARVPLAGARLIANGVDTALFHPGDRAVARAALDLDPDPDRRVVMISGNFLRVNPWKGFPWVLETAERLGWSRGYPGVDFLCVGDEGEPLVYGKSRVVFAGHVPDPARMPLYYQAADIYFHPSRADTAPFSVLEAMASGLPVVATNVGGIPGQVEDGRTGYLVRPGDTMAMAEHMGILLSKPDVREEMGTAGRNRVLDRFDFARQAEDFIDWMRLLVSVRQSQSQESL